MNLTYEINPYNGAIINIDIFYKNEINFKSDLKTTISLLTDKKIELVWLFIPIQKSELIPIAVNQGFKFHHSDDTGLQLTLAIKVDAFIPGYATHYIGAGGVVIDNQNRILVVQEKYHKIKHYKLPGGALDPGEHISTAVMREVLEETGIETEFISVNCFRHAHEYRYGKSDIYFTCRLKPISFDIKIDTREISKAIWLPMETYLSDPNIHIFNKRIVEASLKENGFKIESIPGYKSDITHELLF